MTYIRLFALCHVADVPRNPCRGLTPDITTGQSNEGPSGLSARFAAGVSHTCPVRDVSEVFFGRRAVGTRLACAGAGCSRRGPRSDLGSGWFCTRLFSPIRHHHRMNGCQSDHHLRFRRGSTLSAGRRDAGTALRQNGVWVSICHVSPGHRLYGSEGE